MIRPTGSVKTNATGENTGLTFDNARVNQIRVGPRGGSCELGWDSKTCVPKIGFPCKRSGEIKVTFDVASDPPRIVETSRRVPT